MDECMDVIIYTDGACSGNPGPGGWAAILKHPSTGKIKKLAGGQWDTTNNRMELTGPIEALKALDESRRLKVRLVSDSQYVLKGMNEWIAGWIRNNWRRGSKANAPPVKNADLWQTLLALTQKHDMVYEYVRGHCGHPENEECDAMAVEQIQVLRQA